MTGRVVLGALGEVLEALASSRGEEVVGLLVGRVEGDRVVVNYLYHASNIKHSIVEFEADPWHVVQAHVSADKYKLEVVGIYHSHPSCPPAPSHLDVEGMKKWPIVWVIACLHETSAWILRDNKLAGLEVVPGEPKEKS